MLKKLLGQSGRQKIPSICRPTKFENIIENIGKYDIVLLPFENEENLSIKEAIRGLKCNKERLNIAIIIGPEGGFEEREINMVQHLDNVKIVTLGGRILRTETAGPASIAMLSYEFEL